MDLSEFAERIYLNLPYDPTSQQIKLIAALAKFCAPDTPSDSVFLLNGYAGTGKTSLTGALVRALGEIRVPVVLMAPTGRAAKIFSSFAGHGASTIHRRIYRSSGPGSDYDFGAVNENRMRNAIFIIDEASMIGSGGGSEGRNDLLADLIYYVYSGDGCRMILLGDTAQLPPVGCEESPAMNAAVLKSHGLRVTRAIMTETVRQTRSSGILYNATLLRKSMKLDPLPSPRLYVKEFGDMDCVSGEDLADALSSSYSLHGLNDTLLVTRSNKRAVQFNLSIRANILDKEEELCVDERLLVARNNYLWSAKVKGLDFIANGDIAIVNRIYGTESRYGLRFADVSLSFPDREVDVDCKILLDTLTSESPSLDGERMGRLYNGVLMDPDLFSPETPVEVRMKMLRTDPYFNALQVKYAYALTCHKAQGGQWHDVFVDMGSIPPDSYGMEFYRWLYTALTRATGRVRLINPNSGIIGD